MKNSLFLVILLTSLDYANAQFSKGRVIDTQTETGIPYVAVYAVDVQIGVLTDSLGYFTFDLQLPDRFTLRISAAGYETVYIESGSGKQIEVKLNPVHIELRDVIVSSPAGGLPQDNVFKIEHLKLKELNAIQSSSLTEAMANINGVQQASTGNGIGKPVVRGMQGVRVLTMLNGMRIENQQWGGDHGLGITQLGIDAVELIKGPSSLLFGPDAFGGVIYLIDSPYSGQNGQEIELTSRFESASLASTNTLSYKLSRGMFRVNVAGLYSNQADYQLPNGKYAVNSRYRENGLKAAIGLSKKNWVSHLRYSYSNSLPGIPGAHAHEEAEPEVEEESPESVIQERTSEAPMQLITNHFTLFENKFFLKKGELLLLVGNTNNTLMEFEESTDVPAMRINLNNSLYSFRYLHRFSENWRLASGLQGMYQMNTADTSLEEVLIPSFDQMDNGAFSIAYFSKGKWDVQLGIRYDLRILQLSDSDYRREFGSPNAAFGTVWSDSTKTIRFNVSSGFRAPHVSELLSDGVHHSALRYEKGNKNLKSEQSLQFDLSYEVHREHIELVLNPFYNYISNYIHPQPTDSFIDGFQVFEYTQTNTASLYGVDLGIHYHPHFAHWLHIESSYSYIRGEDFSGNSFAMIPQSRFNSFLKFSPKSNWKFQLENIVIQHQYYFEQSRVAVYELPSDAYNLVNVGLNWIWKLKTPLRVAIGIKNVFNESYINHLSGLRNIGLADQGRNYYLNLKYTIPTNFKVKK